MAGVLYCQNLARFYGRREDGISFRPVRRARPSLRGFSRNLTNARQHYVHIHCAEFRYDRTANVQTADTTPLTPANNVWISLHHATGRIT